MNLRAEWIDECRIHGGGEGVAPTFTQVVMHNWNWFNTASNFHTSYGQNGFKPVDAKQSDSVLVHLATPKKK